MKKVFFLLIAITLIASCSDSNSSNFSISGTVDGIKVGKIFLQRLQDSTLVNVDSVVFDGESDFYLKTSLSQPEIMYLHLDVKDGTEFNDRLLFFAEDTTMTMNSTWDNFVNDAAFSGSKNQDIYATYLKNSKKLNVVYTDLVKRSMSLTDETRTLAVTDSINTAYDRYLRKKVLHAINYAQLHNDKVVAPYLLVSEASEANPILLDSVYRSMPKKIQTTVYGKQLSELINNAKDNL
ncbi:uncharacterized protein DUF4369 [Nonlabens xylanidelens]|uniref:Uncharacterized protein DUF4369 n=1 Tax=Nonlabens xylanidelens TaxID=191564 RepID=A0A2S6IH73_9FLAO|nr:DUF4369 domain-containing protein [Nonlabens xylanidelens]PPK93551.1 uncharacterized protein DUF4369 [Nonlabens xylanidelens]PQJ17862.1 hypothetical protein BST94_12605 [Nonlabens xylanidelens]